jgi:hypothetical protein
MGFVQADMKKKLERAFTVRIKRIKKLSTSLDTIKIFIILKIY